MELAQSGEAVFTPPETVRGMKSLDRTLFSRSVKVPCLRVQSQDIGALTKSLKMALLKLPRIKPVAELAQDDPEHGTHKLFLLNPRKYAMMGDISKAEAETLKKFHVDISKLSFYDIDLTYDNWAATDIFRAVLPADSEGLSSYSIIGHIAHLNLKPELMEYKHLIGEVIIDKNPVVKTVVNKLSTIDNTFRNFQMELLAGEDNFVTRTKENGCTFEMDFSKVYWNPRLSTEHQRVVDCLNRGDVLYDVFAGIGPFAIPAAKKRVTVLANDLNPHSRAALVNNIKLNKVQGELVQTFNLDGREFIKTVAKRDLVSRLQTIGSEEATNQVSEREGDNECGQGVNKVKMSGVPGSSTGGPTVDGDGSAHKEGGSDSCVPNSLQTSSVHVLDSNRNAEAKYQFAFVMNLPALAMEFLDVFPLLLSDVPEGMKKNCQVQRSLPKVFCYCFSKSDDPEADVRSRAETILKQQLPLDTSVRMVRNVAPNKEMMCLIFRLTPQLLFGSSISPGDAEQQEKDTLEDGPASKKLKVS